VWSGEIRRRCKAPNIDEQVEKTRRMRWIRWDRGEPFRDNMEHKENGKVKV
jgi:hypothetical protein